MKWTFRILLTSAVSAGVALLLTMVPELSTKSQLHELPVFQQSRAHALSDQNIVDELSALPIELSLSRIDWNASVLSVDLLYDTGQDHADLVYRDLATLSEFGFRRTTNVQQLFVRVLYESGGTASKSMLLLAMDAKRENVPRTALREDDMKNPETLRQYLQSRFRITYTQKWKDEY